MFSFGQVPEIPSDAGIVGTLIIHLSLANEAPFLEGMSIRCLPFLSFPREKDNGFLALQSILVTM